MRNIQDMPVLVLKQGQTVIRQHTLQMCTL